MCKKIDPKKTGMKLWTLCKDRMLSADKIAELLGMSGTRIVYYWFAGEKLPSLERIYGLADILNVTVDDILVAQEQTERWYYASFSFVQGVGFVSKDDVRLMPE